MAWRQVDVAEIPGGLTTGYLSVDGVPMFVRIPGGTELLAVDRANETAARAAAQAGWAPASHHLPGWDVMVLEWLPGRTMSNAARRARHARPHRRGASAPTRRPSFRTTSLCSA
jgi:hypothetical protein